MLNKKEKDSKVEIVAEIANAHQGNHNLAIKIAIDAINAGADAVKFQIYFAEEFLTYNHPKFKHFKNQSFKISDWEKIFKKIKPYKKKIYCDVLGEKALSVGKKYDLDGFKIHSSDINNVNLIKKLTKLKSNKKILLSAGGSTLREIAKALALLKKNFKDITLLYGFQNYPTNINDLNLHNIVSLKNSFGKYCKIGYMDHTNANSITNFYLPLISIKLGAKVIEKHITYDRSKKGIDYYSSLNPNEFEKFVRILRNKENIDKKILSNLSKHIGVKKYFLTKKEVEYRNDVKKVWVAKKRIKKNKLITKNDLIMKRANEKVMNIEFENLIGTKALKNIKKDSIVRMSDINYKVSALIIARSHSKRLPKKIIKNFYGSTALEYIIKRLKRSKKINRIILCTTKKGIDDILCRIAKKNSINYVRGPEEDVLSRMLLACKKNNEIIIRVTGDDILVDSKYIDNAINYHVKNNLEYCSIDKLPSGTEVELYNSSLLFELHKTLKDKNSTEYLTNMIKDNSQDFNFLDLPVKKKHQKKIRLTLDTYKDYQVIKLFLGEMKRKKKFFNFNMDDLVYFFRKRKDVLNINNQVKQKKMPIHYSSKILWNRLIS